MTTGLGTAVIRVDGRQLSGVMSQFDDSLAQNLYRMEFRANIDPTGRQAKGEHSYSFMTGAGFSYSGSITLTLSPDLSRLSIVFTNPIPIEDSFLKVLSGECR
ncbi:hypothetical protein [Futiania mangrovi]|uniref:Uncharacterized protein n=1 Tax=Futiania mangrovi TaxID=2959716 RepID=A0A9J6PCL8_9PROT|nr:hypothetical protein [Futiania mangrovii]MCP1335544.1 hypothetical protein [Futiania mangrovii]